MVHVASAIVMMSRLDKIAEASAKATAGNGRLSCKVSQKGALSVYGLSRWPVTLYAEQWERLLGFGDELKAFMAAQNGSLNRKRPVAEVPAAA